jgi:hypothetical protein
MLEPGVVRAVNKELPHHRYSVRGPWNAQTAVFCDSAVHFQGDTDKTLTRNNVLVQFPAIHSLLENMGETQRILEDQDYDHVTILKATTAMKRTIKAGFAREVMIATLKGTIEISDIHEAEFRTLGEAEICTVPTDKKGYQVNAEEGAIWVTVRSTHGTYKQDCRNGKDCEFNPCAYSHKKVDWSPDEQADS